MRERTARMNLSGSGSGGQGRGGAGGGGGGGAASSFGFGEAAGSFAERRSAFGGAAATAGAADGGGADSAAAAAAEANRMKEAGNRAFRAGRYQVAAANYNGALELMSRNCTVTPAASASSGAAAATTTTTTTMASPKPVVMGGRDAAVCYANRAAARLMNVGANVVGVAAAEEVREALADCHAALTADPEFDRARLRAGTCLMKLGALREAEAMFRSCPAAAAAGGDSEAKKLAGDAARASSSLATLRAETLPKLRAATLEGAADAAAAARRAVARSASGDATTSTSTSVNGDDAPPGEWRALAEKVLGLVAPLSALAPHSGEVAEAKARALLCVGKFTEAGFGGVRRTLPSV